MENEQIIQGHKLIAAFISDMLDYSPYSEQGDFISDIYTGGDADATYFDWLGMRFHKSWDWLMPVVEKIESLDMMPFVVINGYHCEISRMINHNWPEDKDVIASVGHPQGESKIDSTYQAVITFIERYNSQPA